MAEKSYFFDDVNDDRVYLAEDFAMFFSTLIANGIFPNPSTNNQVMANEENPMTVSIMPGKAWINGYLYWNPDNLAKTLEPAYTNPRIDRVVIRWSSNNREIMVGVITGTPATSPVAPELTRNSDIWELAIANIYVGGGVTAVTQANITDTRLSDDLCGIVHALVQQVQTETIFNQYLTWFNQMKASNQADFEEWFSTIQGVLSGDVAGNLLNLINDNTADIAANTTNITANATAISNLKKFQTAGGTATAITLSNVELTDGFQTTFVILSSNSGSATTINGKQLYKPGTTTAPKLVVGKAATVWYNSTGDCFFIKASSEGTAIAGEVLAGKTFSNDDDVGISGTLALTGDAAAADVYTGKKFYNTDPKAQVVGTNPYKSGGTMPISSLGGYNAIFHPLCDVATGMLFFGYVIVGVSDSWIYIAYSDYTVHRLSQDTKQLDNTWSVSADSADNYKVLGVLEDDSGNVYVFAKSCYKFDTTKTRIWKTLVHTNMPYSYEYFWHNGYACALTIEQNPGALSYVKIDISSGTAVFKNNNIISTASNCHYPCRNSNYFYEVQSSPSVVKKYSLDTGAYIKDMFNGDTSFGNTFLLGIDDSENLVFEPLRSGTYKYSVCCRKEGNSSNTWEVTTILGDANTFAYDPVNNLYYLFYTSCMICVNANTGTLEFSKGNYSNSIYVTNNSRASLYNPHDGTILAHICGVPQNYNTVIAQVPTVLYGKGLKLK